MAANNNESTSDNIENISFRDGNCLADLLIKNEYAWNISCQKVIACDDTPKVSFGNIDISILNPSKEDLNTLADVWMKDISRQCKKVIVCNNHLFDRAFEGYFIDDMEYSVEKEKISYSSDTMIDWKIAAELDDDHPDKSVSNQSSIVVMIEYDGKTYLFTGDCPITKIKWKLPTKITLVKLPHHGSGKSNEKEFIRTRKVDYYLISTDGSHNHPSKSIIGNILCCSKEQATIVKNYDTEQIEVILDHRMFERKIAYSEEMIMSNEMLDKKCALDYIVDALQYFISVQKPDGIDKKYAEAAKSVCPNQNSKVYAVVKAEIREVMKLSNEYFDIRHNEYLVSA